MIMPEEKAELRHGTQVNYSMASFVAWTPYLLSDGTTEVKIAVETDQDREYRLHPGDTFQVRDQTWKLDHIENPEDRANWRVHIVRVS
jgi:hypothetical protein